jgi:hypothetical protein
MPTASLVLLSLVRNDLRFPADRRAAGKIGIEIDCLRIAADGRLPPGQTAYVSVCDVDPEQSLLPVSGCKITCHRHACAELVAALPTQPRLNGDEPPTQEESIKSWLWTFVADNFTVFAPRARQ